MEMYVLVVTKSIFKDLESKGGHLGDWLCCKKADE